MMTAEPLGVKSGSMWRRWWQSFVAFAEAADTSYAEIQDNRIARLETEVRELKSQLSKTVEPRAPAGSDPFADVRAKE